MIGEIEQTGIVGTNVSRITLGVVMVKPHAMVDGFDQTIEHIITVQPQEVMHNIGFNDSDRADFAKMSLCLSACVNLGDGTTASEYILNSFYGDAANEEHYPVLRRIYADVSRFFIVAYDGEQKRMFELLKKFKGNPRVLDRGKVIKEPLGIRGLYLPTAHVTHNNGQVSEEERQLAVERGMIRMLNNLIHTSIVPSETYPVIEVLLSLRRNKQLPVTFNIPEEVIQRLLINQVP